MEITIGDTVKVIGKTVVGGHEEELIPIGTICRVVDLENNYVGVIPEYDMPYHGYGEFYYLPDDLEKGHMEWIKDKE